MRMEIEADTAEEFRGVVLVLLAKREAACRVQLSFCRTIGERRAVVAATKEVEGARMMIEGLVIKPKNAAGYTWEEVERTKSW